jgi:hypothetical protein
MITKRTTRDYAKTLDTDQALIRLEPSRSTPSSRLEGEVVY